MQREPGHLVVTIGTTGVSHEGVSGLMLHTDPSCVVAENWRDLIVDVIS